ncbi:IS3 family transposase [Halosquirtibacter laminarini]|uniref:IS3 family transposase n=1 Tax=Halosquirtibacter laminarini TaxID=3374600 RepID=A0AC61NJR0_9BACT|nr:IS3 family transposase [Prolixibacteraceae bacterium]
MKKGSEHILQERQHKYEFIATFNNEFTVEDMCRVMQVSRSGFYDWLSREEAPRSIAIKEDTIRIREIYEQSKYRYGSHKITAELRVQGVVTSRNRVARIMKKESIKSIVNKKYKVQTTDSNHSNIISDNHLDRKFSPDEPSKVWVSDITYVPTDQGWLYLTTVIDLFDRKVIGWSLSDNMTTECTIIKAWRMAKINRDNKPGMIFHSDRGVQYTAKVFRDELVKDRIKQSMSRKGNCWDNAVAESFFKIIKSEMIDHKHYHSHFHAKIDIIEFIEIWYNRQRRHATLGYLTPLEFGKQKYFNVA